MLFSGFTIGGLQGAFVAFGALPLYLYLRLRTERTALLDDDDEDLGFDTFAFFGLGASLRLVERLVERALARVGEVFSMAASTADESAGAPAATASRA